MERVIECKTSQKIRVLTESGDVVVIQLVFIKNMHNARIRVLANEHAEIIAEDDLTLKKDPFGQPCKVDQS